MAKQRPRAGKWGVYTPAATVNYETLVKEIFAVKYPNHQPSDKILAAQINAYFSIPKSTSKKKYREMLEGGIRPKKIDCDNCAKIVLDALNKIAYHDDRQVVELHVHKYYAERPRVEIMIREVD